MEAETAPAAQPVRWRNAIVRYGEEPPEQLLAHPQNPKIHPKQQQDALAGAIDELGWLVPVVVNLRTQHVLDGHARIGLAISKGEPAVPVAYVDLDAADEAKALATLDPIGGLAVYDRDMLDQVLREVDTGSEAIQSMLDDLAQAWGVVPGSGDEGGLGLDDGSGADGAERRSLADRFVVPPFSVLDARQGYWQERKRAWIDLGIQSELGRGGNGLGLSEAREEYRQDAGDYSRSGAVQPVGGGDPRTTAWLSRDAGGGYAAAPGSVRGKAQAIKAQDSIDAITGGNRTGTSIFDPVLCELVYRWFSPPGGTVLDPFAGGSVRGILAARLDRRYTGIDLRPEQVAANRAQAAAICPDAPPTWLVGDSADLGLSGALLPADYACDLVFNCPPYGDLEVYSDDPRDLSTMDYPAFLAAYRGILAAALGRLRDDRFACVVVGDIRDPRGLYRNFVSDTIAACQEAGARLYNHAVLVTMVGSLPIRAGRQFASGRKLGTTHQHVLVFVKGDPKRAADACGPVEVALPEEEDVPDVAGGGAGAAWESAEDTDYD